MTTSLHELFHMNGKEIIGGVKWGEQVPCKYPGVYVVALAASPDKITCFKEILISKEAVQNWIDYVPNLLLDGMRPSAEALANRLRGFWLPDETIVYIGSTKNSIKNRVSQYYHTPLGAHGPHAGGNWIKTLSNLSDLYIYWTITEREQARSVESEFLKTFVKNVSCDSRKLIIDPDHPFPFANLVYPHGIRKNHGISNPVNR